MLVRFNKFYTIIENVVWYSESRHMATKRQLEHQAMSSLYCPMPIQQDHDGLGMRFLKGPLNGILNSWSKKKIDKMNQIYNGRLCYNVCTTSG